MSRNSCSNESNMRMIRSAINMALDAVNALTEPDPENPDGPDLYYTPELTVLAETLNEAYTQALAARETLPK